MVVAAKSRSSLHKEKYDFKPSSYSKIYIWKVYCQINHFEILNWKSTDEYWFVVLGKELK